MKRTVAALVTCLVLVVIMASPVLASNMGFKLNIVSALNALFRPTGYDASGGWSGSGSGICFSIDWSGNEADVARLRQQTPAGTISLPYVDASVRYAGTGLKNFAPGEAIHFESADGQAMIDICSVWDSALGVRFGGTNLTVETPQGPIMVAANVVGGDLVITLNGKVIIDTPIKDR